jgi:hypothetical protein
MNVAALKHAQKRKNRTDPLKGSEKKKPWTEAHGYDFRQFEGRS